MTQKLLRYLHPSQGRNSGLHLSRGTISSSPPPLQTMLEFKSLFWRLKILPLPQPEALPSPILWGQPAWVPLLAAGSSFPLSMSKGRTQLCFHTENIVCINIQNSYFNNILLTKHFGNILFCILAVVPFVSYSTSTVSQGLSSGSQLFPVLLAAAKTPAKACQTNCMPPGSSFCLALSKWRVLARTNKPALLFNLANSAQ